MTDLDVAVVGGGISGLAAAHELRVQGLDVAVFESEAAVGGRMRTFAVDGFVVDGGTETIARYGYPCTWKLIDALHLRDSVMPVRAAVGLWRDGRIHPWVGHPLSGFLGGGLTLRGRFDLARMTARILTERWNVEALESSRLSSQTIEEFGRRYGPELFDYLLQPAVGTAFGWDASRSSAAPVFGTMLATRGIWRWKTYRGGMDLLARRIGDRVEVHSSCPVAAVSTSGGGARIEFPGGGNVTSKAAIVAVPGPIALEICGDIRPEERSYLEACSYSSMIRVSCLLKERLDPARGRFDPRIYALLIPAREGSLLSGLTFEHAKAEDRSPLGKGLVTLLVAPGKVAELMDAPDEEVSSRALAAAERFLPGVQHSSYRSVVHKFPHAQPEATPHALALRGNFAARPLSRIEFAGDWIYLQPSSEGAVRAGLQAAERLLATGSPAGLRRRSTNA